ncbi:MAG: hypothetical protein IJ766_03865 [Clostridia bacterium]|nr:hypothetical protein [Clostridia bacterium]
MRLIDADELCKDRVSNDPVVIAAKCAPTIDAEPVRHGAWIAHNYLTGNVLLDENETYLCSVCQVQRTRRNKYNFCPNCGAKMDGGAE